MVSLPEFILTATGAFIIWTLKGFKGKFDDQMVSLDQRSTVRGITRLGLGLVVWVAAFLTVGKILS